jgi:hypothetical protein
MAVSISGRNITVKHSVPAVVVVSAIADVARAAETSIDHRESLDQFRISLL